MLLIFGVQGQSHVLPYFILLQWLHIYSHGKDLFFSELLGTKIMKIKHNRFI